MEFIDSLTVGLSYMAGFIFGAWIIAFVAYMRKGK